MSAPKEAPHPMCIKRCQPCSLECGVVAALAVHFRGKAEELLDSEPAEAGPEYDAWRKKYDKAVAIFDARQEEWRTLSKAWVARLPEGSITWPTQWPSEEVH